jgi:hypothetical protein
LIGKGYKRLEVGVTIYIAESAGEEGRRLTDIEKSEK